MKALTVALFLAATTTAAFAQLPPPVALAKTDAPIQIDGDLSDAGWQNAAKYETWYETNPGDNVEPKVKTVGWITYDSKFLYVAVDAYDNKPSDITAPYADHDQISGNTDDYAGIIVDTRNDGKTAYLFLVTARGV